jgi:hypothetical protein
VTSRGSRRSGRHSDDAQSCRYEQREDHTTHISSISAPRVSAIQSPIRKAPADRALQLPAAAFETLTGFIDYSDVPDVAAIEATLARIQIHAARTSNLVEHSQDATWMMLRADLLDRIVDAGASMPARVSALDYANEFWRKG